MKQVAIGVFVSILAMMAIQATMAAGQEPDSEELEFHVGTCERYLAMYEADDARSSVFTVWAMGVYDCHNDLITAERTRVGTAGEILDRFEQRLIATCEANPKKVWVEAIKELKPE